MNEMNQLINDTEDIDKRKELTNLKLDCKFAYSFIPGFESSNRPGKPWSKKRYRSLQQTKEWKRARLLIKKYYTIDGILTCPECKQVITENQSFTLHHDLYPKNPYNLFNPLYCKIIHTRCHRKGNPQKW